MDIVSKFHQTFLFLFSGQNYMFVKLIHVQHFNQLNFSQRHFLVNISFVEE